jgi:hypothetical protein
MVPSKIFGYSLPPAMRAVPWALHYALIIIFKISRANPLEIKPIT